MAEHEKDAQLSQRYRDLGREEPPRHVDDAILAASRREVRRKPWLYPVAAAAVLGVLAVAVSVHMEREQPEEVVAMKDTAPVPVFVPDPKPDRRDDTGDLARQAPAAASPRMRQAERPLAALGLDEAPMPWLERIAKLREEGKHEDADRALAEFRKRYPDFRIPEAMLGRVEKK